MNATLATVVVIIFITAITISAELSPQLKGWLAGVFSHHWIGKSVLATVVWVVAAAIPSKVGLRPKWLAAVLTASTFAIVIFYVVHYLLL